MKEQEKKKEQRRKFAKELLIYGSRAFLCQ